MAETKAKTRSASSSRGGSTTSKSKSTKSAGSRGRSSTANGSKRAATSRKRNGSGGSSTSRSRGTTKSTTKRTSTGSQSGSSRSSPRSKSNGSSTRRSGSKPQTAGSSSGGDSFLDKAKGPATAVGAALLGAAGMAAVRRNGKGVTKLLPGRGSSGLVQKGLKSLPKPKLDASTIDWVEEKAKGLGDASYRVAEMTDQARKLRKAVNGD